ncbi:DUF881 domain-containing protein [Bacillus andreraoultii]|uniref:DUF881 domain-containing protein n=1 Tax=Bacillus andreraoultii TaxID=1499685 RepID=UPI00053A67C8|nr:DUF881 domain-containing protein [Bacillus andreraoultii]
MIKKNKLSLFLISVLVGFMVVIQFNITKQDKHVEKDKGDLWGLRENYLAEKELEANLLREIRTADEKIAQYETERHNSSGQVLQKTLSELEVEAGLKETIGPGIVLSISPAYEFIVPGQNDAYLSPDVLRKLINELNMYGAKAISIANKRVITTTTIRNIQGETKVDGYPLKKFPIEVKVITNDEATANKLYNRMQVSTIPDEFFIDNLTVSISKPKDHVTISAYENSIVVNEMETVKEEGKK